MLDMFYLLSVFPVTLSIIFVALYLEENALRTVLPNNNNKITHNNNNNKYVVREGEHLWNIRSFFK